MRRVLPGKGIHFRRVFLLGLLGSLTCAVAASAGAEDAPWPLFEDSETLVATLEVPTRKLRKRKELEAPLDGRFTYLEGGKTREFAVAVSKRGHSRRELCDMPPLRLDFRRGDLADSLLDGQNKLKLVTHCRASSTFYRYVEHEYAIYRAYSRLTDAAFRVRKLELSYRDAERPGRVKTYPAFLIESKREVAERLGFEEVEVDLLADADLEPGAVTRLALFQYMVGNTDWSLRRGRSGEPCCHNGLLLRDPSGRHVIVPYDFDQAGIIDADYALPAEGLGIRSVRQRLFRGLCTGDEQISAVIDLMNTQRGALEAEFVVNDRMKRANRRARAYLDEFFDIVNDPAELQSKVVADCRGDAGAWTTPDDG